MILFPGTAVPTPDTYTNTFIPVFKDQDVAGADVMLITNPSISLGMLKQPQNTLFLPSTMQRLFSVAKQL